MSSTRLRLHVGMVRVGVVGGKESEGAEEGRDRRLEGESEDVGYVCVRRSFLPLSASLSPTSFGHPDLSSKYSYSASSPAYMRFTAVNIICYHCTNNIRNTAPGHI